MKDYKKLGLVVFLVVIGFVGANYLKDLRAGPSTNNIQKETLEKEQAKVNNLENTRSIDSEVKEADAGEAAEDKDVENLDPFYIKDEAEFEQVLADKKPTILMFGTKSCTFCNQMRPYVSEISGLYQDKINLRYVDAEKLPDLAYRYPLKGVPAFMYQNADKSGYTPSEGVFAKLHEGYNSPAAYALANSDEHAYTMTYGFMKRELVIEIVEELIANAK